MATPISGVFILLPVYHPENRGLYPTSTVIVVFLLLLWQILAEKLLVRDVMSRQTVEYSVFEFSCFFNNTLAFDVHISYEFVQNSAVTHFCFRNILL